MIDPILLRCSEKVIMIIIILLAFLNPAFGVCLNSANRYNEIITFNATNLTDPLKF